MFFSFLALIIAIYGGLCLFLYFSQENFIFFPAPLSPKEIALIDQHFTGSALEIQTHDGKTLRGWHLKSKRPEQDPLILYYGGNAEEVSANLLDWGKIPNASILYLNYRGYGGSTGKPGEKELVADGLQVYDYVTKELGYRPDQIVLMGRSLGSGVAIQVAGRRSVRGLILITPFDSLQAVAQKAYPIFPVGLFLRHPFRSDQWAEKIDRPLLALIAQQDSVIPNINSQYLLKKWQGPNRSVVIPGADHNDLHEKGLYWSSINEFLESL